MQPATHPTNKSSIRNRLTSLGCAFALFSPMYATALEIGAPISNPILGNTLRLEIPLTLTPGTKVPRSDCARLVPRPDDADGDYFPREIRATIEPRRGGAMLIVSSTHGVASPVVGFRVLMGCDAGVSRDFMLLASQREVTAAATPAAASGAEPTESKAVGQPADAGEMVIAHDTTLNKLARARYPSNRETRDEYRRLIAEANPALFANAGDRVGSVPLPAGTTLKMPGGLPKKEARPKKEAAEQQQADALPQAGARPGVSASDAAGAAEEKPPRGAPKKTDRLVIGSNQGRVPSLSQQELKQSLDRLEQMMGEKSRGDIAMSETLTSLAASFGEVKTYLQGVDERIKRAEAEQQRAQNELESLRQELHNSYSLIELVIAIVGGGAIGAALIVLFQRLAARPQPAPFGAAAGLPGSAAPAGTPAAEPMKQAAPAPVKTAPAKATEPAARTAPPPGTNRIEPTVKPVVGRPAHPMPQAAAETIPERFTDLKKPAAETVAPAAAKTEPADAPETTKFDIALPEAGGTATDAPLLPAASEPQLPITENDLELRLGDSEADLAEKAVPDSGVDPVLELADVMTSLGLAKEAASAVIEHIRQNPHQDPSHWFKVLDIYRSTGHREAFDEAVQELRQNLNVAVEAWGTDPSKIEKASLEDYSHLSRELQALWPKPECEEFLTKLLEDNRGGKRAGFPQSVAEEIVLLKAILRNAPQIDFPPIGGTEEGSEQPDRAAQKDWREMRLIP